MAKNLAPQSRPSRRRELVPLADAAKYLGVSTDTVRRMVAAGRIEGFRVGPRMLRVDLAEIDASLEPIPTAVPAGGEPR